METIKAIHSRNSISNLIDPFPSKDEMELVYKSALRAPDHAWLRPWRFIQVTGDSRSKLSDAFLETYKELGYIKGNQQTFPQIYYYKIRE